MPWLDGLIGCGAWMAFLVLHERLVARGDREPDAKFALHRHTIADEAEEWLSDQ